MKKSTLIMILSLVLAVALGVGGTLAYLTDDDGDVNVMTVGNVQIT
ncbi:MAG: SipW-dependent-type signal peptide-containing protein, partial [Clostridia bacterium]|nr:SipW-dependent-type signal peptide-containing protein [Clostridia bacterium]